MLKVKPLSAEQKEHLMQSLPILRKLYDNGMDIIGFNMTGCELEIWARDKLHRCDELVFPFMMYTDEPELYQNVYKNQS